MENYLNTINLGQNTLGVQSASRRYFGKDVSELSLSEGAVIAGITKNPSAYNPVSHPKENDKRRRLVLKNMKDQGYISDNEYNEALKDDVYSRIQQVNIEYAADNPNSYFFFHGQPVGKGIRRRCGVIFRVIDFFIAAPGSRHHYGSIYRRH